MFDYNQVESIGKFVTALESCNKNHDELDDNEFIQLNKRQLGYLKSIAFALRGPLCNFNRRLPTDEEDFNEESPHTPSL